MFYPASQRLWNIVQYNKGLLGSHFVRGQGADDIWMSASLHPQKAFPEEEYFSFFVVAQAGFETLHRHPLALFIKTIFRLTNIYKGHATLDNRDLLEPVGSQRWGHIHRNASRYDRNPLRNLSPCGS